MSTPPDNIGTGDFKLVTFGKEIETILNELNLKTTAMAVMTEDSHQFMCNVKHVADEMIYMEVVPPASRDLRVGEAVQAIFGLRDGLYVLRAKLETVRDHQCSMPLGRDLYRMQRRNNFRTPVPAGSKIQFKLTAFRNAVPEGQPSLAITNLSAGGVRAVWAVRGVTPVAGDTLAGFLSLPGGRQIELFGIVRTLHTVSPTDFQIGIEFQNVSLRDEQALLFACLQMQRGLLRP